MNTFDILGYRSDRAFSKDSKTSVFYFALIKTTVVRVFRPIIVMFM